jgi:hypothetical protein
MIKQSKILSLPENIEAPLWRYMSIEKLESLLKESALYFRRADLFEDPLEGTQSLATIKNRPSFFAEAKESWINKTMPMFDARTRKCVYVNCWHNNDTESIYMWDKYTKENKGIAIKSSLNRIRRAILDREREFLINPVRYINYEKEHTSDANSFYAFFCKEASYINEREVRFAFDQKFEHVGDADFDSLPLEEGIFIPVDNNLLIEKVIISPYTKEVEINKVYNLLDKYQLRDKLQHSAL